MSIHRTRCFFLNPCFRTFKKIMRKYIFLVCIFALVFSASCSSHVDRGEENTGTLITREVLESMASSQDQADILEQEGIDTDELIVFWSPNGSVFHSTPECSSISNSREIICGNVVHAYNCKITASCSRCFEKENDR